MIDVPVRTPAPSMQGSWVSPRFCACASPHTAHALLWTRVRWLWHECAWMHPTGDIHSCSMSLAHATPAALSLSLFQTPPLPLPLLSLCLPSYSCKQALVPNIMGYGAKGLPMGGLQRNIFSQPEKRLTSRQRPPPLLVLRKDGALADDTGDRWDLAREETRAAAWGARRRQAHAPLPARPSRGGELSRLAQAPGAGSESVEGAESEGADDDDAGRRGHGKGFRNGFMGALTDTKFDKDIFALAIPALGSLIIEPVVRTLEAVMVGRLGAAPLGALSIGGSVVSVSFPLFNFFSYATTPMVARALARNDPDEASRLVCAP